MLTPPSTPPASDSWFTTRDAAEHAKVSEATIYRAVADGILVGYRINGKGHLRFRQRDVDAWIEGRSTTGPVTP